MAAILSRPQCVNTMAASVEPINPPDMEESSNIASSLMELHLGHIDLTLTLGHKYGLNAYLPNLQYNKADSSASFALLYFVLLTPVAPFTNMV